VKRLLIDIETRSVLDLPKAGIHNYARDPSTSITHLGFTFDDSPIEVWQPRLGEMPGRLWDLVTEPATEFVAHNAAFERLVLSGPAGRALGFPEALQAPERWTCTMARAAALGLPRGLDDACSALNLPLQKDREGHQLMLQCCKPRSLHPLTWWQDESRMTRMAAYCRRDVECEAQLEHRLPELSPTEHAVWAVTEKMNDAGVLIDAALLKMLTRIVQGALAKLDKELCEITAGAIKRVSMTAALVTWLRAHGLDVNSCDKHAVAELLERDDLDPTVERVLEIRQEGGGSSTKKLVAVARQFDALDGRLRHQLVYAGAIATGRWSSTGVQLQNLPRNRLYDLAPILRDLEHGITATEIADIYGPPLQVASELLRPLIVAPHGHWLIIADFAQVEARVLAWLAGEQHRLQMFRDYDAGGPDPYSVTAALLFGVTIVGVKPDQRPLGKAAELAFGFQGGHRAIQKQARNFGLRIPKAQAEEYKLAWRAANPAIVQFWADLERAACSVIGSPPGRIERVDLIEFTRTARAMTAKLPSGRKLIYWAPTLRERETPWGELRLQPHCFGRNNLTKKWENGPLYGGLFCENVVQATARDLLAQALIRLDTLGLNPILTIHDEIIVQADQDATEAVSKVMRTVPGWARGLPLAASVVSADRYAKG
jgi:DNA polymerase